MEDADWELFQSELDNADLASAVEQQPAASVGLNTPPGLSNQPGEPFDWDSWLESNGNGQGASTTGAGE